MRGPNSHFGSGHLPLVDPNAAGGGTSPMVVSDHMTYGSYSGADIKVVLHYPIDRAGIRVIEQEKSALETAIQEERAFNNTILGNTQPSDVASADPRYDSTTAQAQTSSNEYIALLEDEIKILDENISNLKESPTAKTLAELQTFSWSIFREKDPVRSLGAVYPRAFTRGGRTISGSMVFTVFYEHVLHEALKLNLRYKNTGTTDRDPFLPTTMLPDQLPPVDLTLIFANEYGAISTMGLYGVEFFNEGGTFSIEDIYSESTMQYVARDLDPMRSVAQRAIDSKGVSEDWQTTASDMLQQKRYVENGHVYRRNPFI